jgi:serralysin
MNGTQVLGGGSVATLDNYYWDVVGTADYNGDRRHDILWQNVVTGATTMWLMDGNHIIDGGSISTTYSWWVAGSGDYDRDGRGDILWQRPGGLMTIWSMNGTQTISSATVATIDDPDWHDT